MLEGQYGTCPARNGRVAPFSSSMLFWVPPFLSSSSNAGKGSFAFGFPLNQPQEAFLPKHWPMAIRGNVFFQKSNLHSRFLSQLLDTVVVDFPQCETVRAQMAFPQSQEGSELQLDESCISKGISLACNWDFLGFWFMVISYQIWHGMGPPLVVRDVFFFFCGMRL